MILLLDDGVPLFDLRFGANAGKARGSVRLVLRLRCTDQCLGRYAPNIDAGATDRAVTDQRDLRALFGRRDSGREAG